jgi:hypothetical protein
LIWLEAWPNQRLSVSEHPMPETPLIGGIPLYAFDKHTRLGKRAVRELIAIDTPLTACLEKFVDRTRWQAAAEMAAFYADAALVAGRLEWALSGPIEAMGTEADFSKVGVPLRVIKPLQAAMAASLGHLNEIREALWLKARASAGPGR